MLNQQQQPAHHMNPNMYGAPSLSATYYANNASLNSNPNLNGSSAQNNVNHNHHHADSYGVADTFRVSNDSAYDLDDHEYDTRRSGGDKNYHKSHHRHQLPPQQQLQLQHTPTDYDENYDLELDMDNLSEILDMNTREKKRTSKRSRKEKTRHHHHHRE